MSRETERFKEWSMTRVAKRRTSDRLHCTFSAIIDIFEMENKREPSPQEVNNLIQEIGSRGSMVK